MKPYKTLLKHPLKEERNFLRLLLIIGNLGSTYVENLNVLNFFSLKKVTIFFLISKKMKIIEYFFWHFQQFFMYFKI